MNVLLGSVPKSMWSRTTSAFSWSMASRREMPPGRPEMPPLALRYSLMKALFLLNSSRSSWDTNVLSPTVASRGVVPKAFLAFRSAPGLHQKPSHIPDAEERRPLEGRPLKRIPVHFMFMSAPLSRRIFAISRLPFRIARCSADAPAKGIPGGMNVFVRDQSRNPCGPEPRPCSPGLWRPAKAYPEA